MLSRWVLACLLSVWVVFGYAADPGLDWETLETPHFRVHYPVELRSWGQRTAGIAEALHAELSPRLRWTPKDKTDIRLVDELDEPNGLTSVLPFDQIEIVLDAPLAGDFLTVRSTTDWLEQVLRHEYTHVLHLDANRGAPAAVQKVLGRDIFTFPALFQPNWVHEGLAVWQESAAHIPERGRLNGAEYEMMMREEVLHGFKPLREVSLMSIHSPPYGSTPYLYGSYYMRYLEEHYGGDGIMRWLNDYRGQLLPYRINTISRHAFQLPLDSLWHGFLQETQTRVQATEAALNTAGIQQGTPVGGLNFLQPTAAATLADGSLFVVQANGRQATRLWRVQADGKAEALGRVSQEVHLSVHPSAGIVLSQLARCDHERYQSDLFWMALDGGTHKRLTHCGRWRAVSWHPDGAQLAAVAQDQGRSSVWLLTAKGDKVRQLWSGGDDALVSEVAWAPDGKSLLLLRSTETAGFQLVQMDITSLQEKVLLTSGTAFAGVRYASDGQSLLLHAGWSGSYELYRLDLGSSALTQLTRSRTGLVQALEPKVGGPLYGLYYGDQPYELHRIETTLAIAASAPAVTPLPPLAAAIPGPTRPYRPWSSLRPRSWEPYTLVDTNRTELGISIGGQDALDNWAYSLTLGRELDRGTTTGALLGVWDQRVFLQASRELYVTNGNNKWQSDQVANRLDATFMQPFAEWSHFHGLSLGLDSMNSDDSSVAQGLTAMTPERERWVGARVQFANWQRLLLLPVPTDGVALDFVADRSFRENDNSPQGTRLRLSLEGRYRLGEAGVAGVRLRFGHGSTESEPFTLGGTVDSAFQPLFPWGRSPVAMDSVDSGTAGLTGTRFSQADVSWYTPLQVVDRTFLAPPLGLGGWYGRFYWQTGHADSPEQSNPWVQGIGAEWSGQVWLGYLLPLHLTVGLGEGLSSSPYHHGRVYAQLLLPISGGGQ